MALTWPANIPIAYESQKKTTPRVLSGKFGTDGFEQRAPDGINSMPRSGTLKVDQGWDVVNTLDAFLVSTQGTTAFWFTPPYDTPGTFVADKGWTITQKGYDYALMEIPIREVFELQ